MKRHLLTIGVVLTHKIHRSQRSILRPYRDLKVLQRRDSARRRFLVSGISEVEIQLFHFQSGVDVYQLSLHNKNCKVIEGWVLNLLSRWMPYIYIRVLQCFLILPLADVFLMKVGQALTLPSLNRLYRKAFLWESLLFEVWKDDFDTVQSCASKPFKTSTQALQVGWPSFGTFIAQTCPKPLGCIVVFKTLFWRSSDGI